MGGRDYRRREPKKQKKDVKKIASTPIVPTPATVEVIKSKGKKEPKEEE